MSEYYKGLMYILVEAGIIRKESTPSYSELLMAVKTLAEQKDRPDREKIVGIEKFLDAYNATNGAPTNLCLFCHAITYDGKQGIIHKPDCVILELRSVIALFPDIEEAKREEGERIIKYLDGDCPHMEGWVRMACDKCWQALKGDPRKKEVKTNKGEANA